MNPGSPAESSRPARRASFGLFEVDLEAGEVRKGGLRIKVQEKPFQILRLLLEHAGELVTREQLSKRLWPDETFVDFDANLKTAINKLRRALGDSSDNPRFVETIQRRGYRFVAPVVFVEKSKSEGSLVIARGREQFVDKPLLPLTAGRESRRWRAATLGLLVLLTVVASTRVSTFRFWQKKQESSKALLLVLPFENLSGDPTQEYFVDGLTDIMIRQLGRQDPKQLIVIARTSAMQYKATRKSVAQIASESGVDYVLQGSVQREDHQIRIVARLVQARNGTILWFQTYERQAADIQGIQRDVSTHIAESLALELLPSQVSTQISGSEINSEAFDDYLRGLYELSKRTPQDQQKSIQFFQQAIQKNKLFANAYAELGYAYEVSASWYLISPEEAYPRAEAAVTKALELDDSLAETHAILGAMLHEYKWDWAGAEKEYMRALEINPNSALTHKLYAEYLIHAKRFNEATSEIMRARALDPFSLITDVLVGYYLGPAGNAEQRVTELKKVIELDPGFASAHYYLGRTYMAQRRFEEALAEFTVANKLFNNAPVVSAELASACAFAGRKPEAQGILAELNRRAHKEYVSPWLLAQVYAALGDKEQLMASLEKAYRERSFGLMFLPGYLKFDNLSSDPRLQQMIKSIGFPTVVDSSSPLPAARRSNND